MLPKLAKRGVRRLVVICPSFVADCLETLEEIAIRAEEDFRAAGGESLTLVPSLNASEAWIDVVVDMAQTATGSQAPKRDDKDGSGDKVAS